MENQIICNNNGFVNNAPIMNSTQIVYVNVPKNADKNAKIVFELGSNGTQYTVPANGYLFVSGIKGNLFLSDSASYTGYVEIAILQYYEKKVYVQKGQTILFNYSDIRNPNIHFCLCEE